MSEPSRRQLYAVDMNVFMDWQFRHYPADIFPSILTRIDLLIAKKRFRSPALVDEEQRKVGTPELTALSGAHPDVWVPNAEVLVATLAIKSRFPGLLDPKAEFDETLRQSEARRQASLHQALTGCLVPQCPPQRTRRRAPRQPAG